jgi:hypothetical protein
MIFLSDYDGDPTEYLAAFGLAMKRGMNLAFGSYAHFPGCQPTRPFIDYVERSRSPALLRYSAYPDVTVRDVDAALAVSGRVDEVRRMVDADDVRFAERYRALVESLALGPPPEVPSLLPGVWHALRARSTVRGLTVLLPVDPDRKAGVVAAVAALAAEAPSVFERIGGVHFARIALVRVAGRRSRPWWARPAEVRDHLLVSAWFDGDARIFVGRLVGALAPRADALWAGSPGCPGADEPERLATWLLDRRLRPALFLGCRSGVSVDQVREALARREQAFDLVTAVAGRPLEDIRRELKRLWP